MEELKDSTVVSSTQDGVAGALLVVVVAAALFSLRGNAGSSALYADKIRFLILLSSGVRPSAGAVSCPLDE